MEVDSLHQQLDKNNADDHYLVMHGKTLKCVCELCTCGKHHCPRPRVKGTFSTSYADTYKDIKLAPSPQPQGTYKYEQRHYNPDIMKSSYQQTYIPKQMDNFVVDSPSRLENAGSRVVYHVPFQGSSSYKDQYKPFALLPPQMNPEENSLSDSQMRKSPTVYRPPQVKFEGVTSYKSQFLEPPKAEGKPMPQQNYQRMQVPFNGSSSYKNDFPEYKIERSKELINDYSKLYKAPQVKFEGHTAYNDSFKGYAFQSPEAGMQQSRVHCAVEALNVPPVNYVNEKNHIYYDPVVEKFV